MRAVVIDRPGGPEVLAVRDVPRPSPPPYHVRVRVHATALNRADLLQREGRYPAPPDAPADIPGLEFAGEVDVLGDGVREWRPGQRVFGLAGGGTYAEYLVAHERLLVEIPPRLSWSEAAAVPEAFITAHDALVTQAALHAGENVLAFAVGSGVGLAAVQLARAGGATVFGTARQRTKIDAAVRVGLAEGLVVDTDLAPIADHARRWTRGAGMDIVIDLVGGPYVAAGLGVLAPRGRHVVIGTLAGREATIPLGRLLTGRLVVRGTMLRGRPLEEKIAATRAFAHEVVPLLARGVVRPVIDHELPLADARVAHELLESNRTIGKVVLVVGR